MKKHNFNMVEIILAIGVVVIGMVAIMALFPIGANQLRDASVDNYGSQAAEEILSVFAAHVRAGTNWANLIEDSTPNSAIEAHAAITTADRDGIDMDTASPLPFDQSIYRDGNYRSFKIIRFEDTDGDGNLDTGENVEFAAVAVLWKSQIPINDTTDLPYTIAAALNIELSWPAELPYNARQKSYYMREVFNPGH